MGAITWRSMMGPALNAEVPMAAATQSMNAGFAGLNRALEQYQGRQKEAVDERTKDNMDAYYAAGSQITDPEQFAQWQAGAGQAMMQGFGKEADQAGARSFNEGRPGELMSQITQGQQFEKGQKDRAAQPIIDRLTFLANSSDEAERKSASDALSVYSGHDMVPNAGALSTDFAEAERGFADRDRQGVLQDRADETHDYTLTRRDLTDTRNDAEYDRTETERTQLRKGEALIQSRINAHREQYAGNQSNLLAVTQELRSLMGDAKPGTDGFIPVTDEGMPDLVNMTRHQRQNFEAGLAEMGLDPSIMESGDTAAAQTLRTELYKNMPPHIAQQLEGQLSGFDSRPPAAIGADAAQIEKNNRVIEAQDNEIHQRYGGIATPGTQLSLNAAAEEALEVVPENSREDFRNEVFKFIRAGGIVMDDGQRILPSPEVLASIIKSTKRRWNRWDTTDMKKSLEEWRDDNKTGSAKNYSAMQRRVQREVNATSTR